jgi:1-aminocyclopropane-1-carboxylate deaminase/D-cysteine desulfhydrase-like pyridoxal-dependent ACC family enzyme
MIKTLARTEGIFLDPIYSGKAMACLFDHIQKGKIDRSDVVIFLHTGGTPALFAYRSSLVTEDLKKQISRI